ncbi:hypothetical protein ACH4D3_40690, partial [Streptomyces sp. NPDC018026]|uniref:hypothetical protein n=1 Tax=Streptomyces sp. NPDC018026 TaxID=3365031 RepID=UPI003797A3D9
MDFLKAHLALQHHLGFDGTAGWKYRSVYDLVAVHGRWSTPALLPAEVRPCPERHCFANVAATELVLYLPRSSGFADGLEGLGTPDGFADVVAGCP